MNPIPASSGKTQRHRLNRGGDRRADAALHRVIIVRLRWHQPTRQYMARRLAEGKTKAEIIRCLKRYLAREIFRLLPRHRHSRSPGNCIIRPLDSYRSINPYSEAAVKTLKYAPVFRDRFGCLADARAFCAAFFSYYNHKHCHGAGARTPRPRCTSAPRPTSAASAPGPPAARSARLRSLAALNYNKEREILHQRVWHVPADPRAR